MDSCFLAAGVSIGIGLRQGLAGINQPAAELRVFACWTQILGGAFQQRLQGLRREARLLLQR